LLVNPFLQQMVNHKIRTLTPNELISYAQTQNIQVTPTEAKKIIEILHQEKKIDIYNNRQHNDIIQKVEKSVSPKLAKKADELLKQFSNLF
jgi:hypothetical protein